MFFFREHFSNGDRKKLSEILCACFFVLDLKYVITNVFRKVFFQHNMRAGTSTDLFQNNKICTTSRSKICSGDVNVLDLFPIFTIVIHNPMSHEGDIFPPVKNQRGGQFFVSPPSKTNEGDNFLCPPRQKPTRGTTFCVLPVKN